MQNNEIDTILGEDIKFRGNLSFKKNLQIDGSIKGVIKTGGNLIIGSSGNVEADIETGTLTVHGNLRGNIVATKKIDIMKNSRLVGDIKTPDLQIQSGARFNGSSIME